MIRFYIYVEMKFRLCVQLAYREQRGFCVNSMILKRHFMVQRHIHMQYICSRYPPLECYRCVTAHLKALLIVTLCLGPAVKTVYKQAQKQVRPVGRTIYVISAIMAVLIVAFLSIIVYLKVQHRKSALPLKQNTSSGSISKSTQSTVQQPSFDLKQSISEIKSCVFNQVSCVFLSSIASCVCYNYQVNKVRRKFGDQISTFNFVVVMATGSVSISNLSVFDVIGSKAREIAGDVIAAAGNEECCPWQHCSFKSKIATPKLRHALLN